MEYDKQLEIINMLSNYDKEDITQIMIIMTYWQEMINQGIIDINDIDRLTELSREKQDKIKNFVSHKITEQIERNNNGNKGKKKEKLWYCIIYAFR